MANTKRSTTALALAAAAGLVAAPAFVSSPGTSALRGAAAPSVAGAQQAPTSAAPSFTAAAAATAIAGSFFAASSSVKTRATLRAEAAAAKSAPPPFNPAKEVGITAPLGFFDPLNFAKEGDEDGFRKLRVAEIKHGRVAMMAAVGAVIQHFVQFPGFEKVPKGLGALTDMPGAAGFAFLVLLSGAFELKLWTDDDKTKEPGNYGNPFSFGLPLGWSTDMRNFEINNGRMAMISAMGIIAAELATGKDAIEQFA